MNRAEKSLIAEMEKMPVIDAHEHLPAEDEVLASAADVFTRIYCHYSITQAITAGMACSRDALKDTSIPLDQRWQQFRPYLSAIKDTGYARSAQIAASDLYGIEDINDQTYTLLSERLAAANKAGIYDRIIRRKCRIERVLNQGTWRTGREGYAPGVYGGFVALAQIGHTEFRGLHDTWTQAHAGPFADAEEWIRFWLQSVVGQGYAGLKFHAGIPAHCIEARQAEQLYRKFRSSSLPDEDCRQLGAWLIHRAIATASEHGMVVAVHCGLHWNCGIDVTMCDPVRLVPLLMRYPATTFDLYHGGIPWVRETAAMANQYPNVRLNLCWCHQISPYMTEQMLNEWIDLVPVTKIIGFGGDACCGPEKTYGALRLARENIARALAIRLARHQMSESRALEVCRLWLYDNPKRIYGLQ